MTQDKIMTERNPRVSLSSEELIYIKNLVDKDIVKGKFDHEKMFFKLNIYKKLSEAR